MTSYFVDFSIGADSNAGTSAGAAWKHCPGDVNVTGEAADCVLVAGDVVTFKGGVVYLGTVTVSWSGSNGNPIAYDGNSNGLWGTGKAIFDGGADTLFENALRYAFTGSASYILVDNFEVRNLKRVFHDTNGENSVAVSFSNCHDLEVLNCYMHDIFPAPSPVVQGGQRKVAKTGTATGISTFTDSTVDFTPYASAGGSLGYYKIVVGWGSVDENCAFGYIGALVGGDIHTVTVYSDIERTTAGWARVNPFGYNDQYFYWLFDMRESHYSFTSNVCIDFNGCYNLKIHHNTLTECRNAISFVWATNADNFEVYDNNISACVWGIRGAGPRGASSIGTGIRIHDNAIHDFTPYNEHGWGWHSDGIFLYGYAGSAAPAIAFDGADIYNNTFSGDFSIANTALIYLSSGWKNARVWNNVGAGVNTGASGYFLMAGGASNKNLWVMNNSLLDSAGLLGFRILNTTGIRYHNNLQSGFNRYIGFFSIEDAASSVTSSSHNLFYYAGMNLGSERMEVSAVHYTISAYMASEWATGCIVQSDPLLTSTADLHLLEGSPAIGAGADLSAYIPATDKDGVTRSDWSIGAYEYVSGGGVQEEGANAYLPLVTASGSLVLGVTV